MGILGWIILGGIAGWIASALTGSRDGCLMNIVIGIVGALIGGFVFSLIGSTGFSGFNLWSLFVAVVGAVILLVVVGAVRRNRS
jgi:uncharacterized membrane protein YeaQ/YmgE (transglycosylase-associated protein family)